MLHVGIGYFFLCAKGIQSLIALWTESLEMTQTLLTLSAKNNACNSYIPGETLQVWDTKLF